MRRARSRRNSAAVSLFPFLAVLICTMGSLILLLVIVVQQARVEADEVSRDTDASDTELENRAEENDDLRQLADELKWQLDMLTGAHVEKQQELVDERLKLSGIEDHIRRLELDLKRMHTEAQALENPANQANDDPGESARELQQVRDEIDALQRELENAREQLGKRPQSYALIPYDGPYGTHRRPIYIECHRDHVVVQPEGVTFTEQDFHGPLGPGNPLAAALRAAREYIATSASSGNGPEPYPLLVVRPDGAKAYSAARSAMQSWNSEFGYELIGTDMRMAYPPSDPELGRRMMEAAERARQRQRVVSQFAGAGRGAGQGGGYVVSHRTGGFVAEDVSAGGRHGASRGAFGGESESELSAGDRGGQGPGTKAAMTGNRDGTYSPPDAYQQNNFDPLPDAASGGDHSSPTGTSGQFETGGQSSPGASRQSDGNNGGAARPRPGSAAAAQSNPSAADGPGGLMTDPISKERGQHWALPGKAPSAIGFTRPIRVACFFNRIVLLPERDASDAPQEVPIGGSLRSSIDQFVSTVRERMDSWGTAGRGSYWKPLLIVDVAPGAEARFGELAGLLRGSGIDVQRPAP